MKVIVTIPAYNEEKTIEDVIKDVKSTLGKYSKKFKFEVIVVNDGSTDTTAEIAEKAGATVISHPTNFGLAEAFRTEMKTAINRKADIIVHTDADGQYLASDIPKLLDPVIRGKADLVLGSRFLGEIESMPLIKKMGNIAFSRVISSVLKTKITDCQTGFRAFTRDVAKRIMVISDYTYTQETIIKAVKNKFRIKEVPVFFAKTKRDDGKSRLIANPFGYALHAWITIFRIYRDYAPIKFFGSVGVSFMLLGLLIGFYILWLYSMGQLTPPHQKIPTILFMVTTFMSGLQIAMFGFLADKSR